MNTKETKSIFGGMTGLEVMGPLSRFGEDLDNVIEVRRNHRDTRTRSFFDPQTGVMYTSHGNGYVRRNVYVKRWGKTLSYSLNPRGEKEKVQLGNRMYSSGVFVLLNDEESRLRLIAEAIESYRNRQARRTPSRSRR